MEKEFDLDGIVPWGRTLDEYCAFFALDGDALSSLSPVLDVGAGPSSFAAEAIARQIQATAIDPIYAASGHQIGERFEQIFPSMVKGLERASYRFEWGYYGSPEAVFAHRRTALERFVADYDRGRQEGRYLAGELPALPMPASGYRLALCSHLLFL